MNLGVSFKSARYLQEHGSFHFSARYVTVFFTNDHYGRQKNYTSETHGQTSIPTTFSLARKGGGYNKHTMLTMIFISEVHLFSNCGQREVTPVGSVSFQMDRKEHVHVDTKNNKTFYND